jgi:hypothetical protein
LTDRHDLDSRHALVTRAFSPGTVMCNTSRWIYLATVAISLLSGIALAAA